MADFVQIEAWIDEEGVELWRNNSTQAYGTHFEKFKVLLKIFLKFVQYTILKP